MRLTIVTLIVNGILFWSQTNAQFVETKVVPLLPVPNSEFGRSLGLSGDYLVVGAGRDGEKGEGAGAAYVFKRAAHRWLQQGKLLATDGGTLDRFGHSVGISQGNIIVGAFKDDAGIGPGAGSAYIFTRSGPIWNQSAKLVASDAAAHDQFGFSVAISRETAIVGAFLDDNLAADAGAAYVFKHIGTEWIEQAKLVASDARISDEFGISVAIDGDRAVVGCPNADAVGINAGAVYVFRRTQTQWVQEAKLTASDGNVLDNFGLSVDIRGDFLLVGAEFQDEAAFNAGAAYLFHRTEVGWVEESKLTAADPGENDLFGQSVAISDEHALVGAFFDDDKGARSGSAYLFRRNADSWIQEMKITAGDGQAGDWFGFAAAIDSQYAVVGKWNDVDGGAAYVYSGYASSASGALHSGHTPISEIGDGFPVLAGKDPPQGSSLATGISLQQNFPNPSNPSTNISFELREASYVSLTVFDLLGSEVVTLTEGFREQGNHVVVWDGTNSTGQRVSSGTYLYRLRSGQNVITRKMVLGK